jgi:hypothetical protein
MAVLSEDIEQGELHAATATVINEEEEEKEEEEYFQEEDDEEEYEEEEDEEGEEDDEDQRRTVTDTLDNIDTRAWTKSHGYYSLRQTIFCDHRERTCYNILSQHHKIITSQHHVSTAS